MCVFFSEYRATVGLGQGGDRWGGLCGASSAAALGGSSLDL